MAASITRCREKRVPHNAFRVSIKMRIVFPIHFKIKEAPQRQRHLYSLLIDSTIAEETWRTDTQV